MTGSDDVRPLWPATEVALPGYRLSVRRAPALTPDAEPAVYVHGLGGAASNWTDLMGLLQDRLDGIAPDLPGFGWSPPPDSGDFTPGGHARAVAALIEHEGQAPVHLFGNSLGGAVVLRMAVDRPDLVRTLTLIAPALPDLRIRRTTAGFPLLAAPLLGERINRVLLGIPPERRTQQLLRLVFADPAVVPQQRVQEAVEELRRRRGLPYAGDAGLASLRGLLTDYLSRGPESPWRLARHIRVPTLIVAGGHDKLVATRTAARAARAIPGAQLVVVPGSGHVPQMEHPEVVARAVRELLSASATGPQTPIRGMPGRRATVTAGNGSRRPDWAAAEPAVVVQPDGPDRS